MIVKRNTLYFMKPPPFSLWLCLLPLCSAWGNLAHRTIALIAEKHIILSPTSNFILSLLGNTSISDASIWADDYKLLPEGRHTSNWHFLNTHDEPPQTCNVSYSYDTDHPCIIDAVANMTQGVKDPSLRHQERKMALMFLLHLIGDLHCPLHVEGLMRGGNDIPVFWDGRETSLHFVWDVSIPQRLTNSTEENEETAAIAWAEKLSSQNQDSKQSPKQWPIRFNDKILNKVDSQETLLLSWAAETNLFVCRAVLKDGIDGVKGKEMSSHYYKESVPVVEYLIWNAGLRLAKWINELAREKSLQPVNSKQIVL